MNIFEKTGNIKKIVNGYKGARVVSAAEELKIFETLGKSPKTKHEVAQKTDIDVLKIETILNALTCMGLIEKNAQGYFLDEYYDVLNPNTPQTQCGYIRHATTMMNKWSELAKAAKTSKLNFKNFDAITGEEESEMIAFIQAMNTNALPQAKFLAEKFDFENHKILDIGAGAGTYCIHIGKTYSTTSGVLMDLPAVCRIIDDNLKKSNLNDRFKTCPQNYNEGLIEGKYNDIFMFAMAHQENDKNLEILLRRAYSSLEIGGRLFLSSFFLNDDRVSPEFSVMFAIEMMVMSANGKVYTHSEIIRLIENAGFKNITRVENTKGPSTLYMADK